MSERFLALATDYDGTIATHGIVDPDTVEALRRARRGGLKLILVSGRELESLQSTFDAFDLFDLMVLENGGLLYEPASRRERPLCDPPPPALVERLRACGVAQLSVGRVVIATVEPHEDDVLHAIRDLGLEHQIIFNKGSIMVLPSGVNKSTGLKEALAELGIAPERTAAVGDAENDHALLELCGLGVAVGNALPSLKEHADLVMEGRHGAGVAELIDRLVANDTAARRSAH